MLSTGINLLALSFCSAVMIFIILRLRKSQQDLLSLRQKELATRVTTKDVDDIVQGMIQELANRVSAVEKLQSIRQQSSSDATQKSFKAPREVLATSSVVQGIVRVKNSPVHQHGAK